MIHRNTNNIMVWDSGSRPPKDIPVLMWYGYSESGNVHSVLKAMEKNSDTLRKEYLKWIYDLGELKIQNKRIVEYLQIEPGFSLWWMSLIAEKSYLKSTGIFDCLRLLTLRDFLIKYKPLTVELVSKDSILSEAVMSLCISLNISYNWNRKGLKIPFWSIQDIRRNLPAIIKAPIFLAYYVIKRWSLRSVKVKKWFSGKDSIFIFSYFIHLDREACANGQFYSHQWESLPEYLHKYGKCTNWIHHFLFSPLIPNSARGIQWLKKFNQDSSNQGLHQFLDSFLTIKIVLITFYRWLRFVFQIYWEKRSLEKSIQKHQTGWLWPLLRKDWKNSVIGTVAMENLIWIGLFDRALSLIPTQKLGVYLCENQGWERAFIHFWKKYGHGTLIAVPHSTIRYWDLRYYDYKNNWESNDTLAQPLPNKIALNGRAAWKAYRNAKQPMKLMVEVEALRYLHLNKIKIKDHQLDLSPINKNLLILGDYVSEMTHRGLKLLNKIDVSIISKYNIHFKSHPATPIQLNRYNNLHIDVTDKPLTKILKKFDLVLSMVTTSASIEPFLAGIPVIVIIDDYDLNSSPLRNEPGVYFVSTTEELHQTLNNINLELLNPEPDEYFWINKELPRWKALLNQE